MMLAGEPATNLLAPLSADSRHVSLSPQPRLNSAVTQLSAIDNNVNDVRLILS